MVIFLIINTNSENIATSFEEKDITLKEASLVVYELERIKQNLISREWDLKLDYQEEEVGK